MVGLLGYPLFVIAGTILCFRFRIVPAVIFAIALWVQLIAQLGQLSGDSLSGEIYQAFSIIVPISFVVQGLALLWFSISVKSDNVKGT